MSDPKQFWMQTRAALVARVLLAAIVAASFLITLAPLGAASSEAMGLMDCCVGKAGHEEGSCSSGVLASSTEPQPEVFDDADESGAPPSNVTSILMRWSTRSRPSVGRIRLRPGLVICTTG